jgi:diguanylate cyclase (GGDEF)-like protein/PAS domain S-box-containing protein
MRQQAQTERRSNGNGRSVRAVEQGVLEMMSLGRPLPEVLNALALSAEKQADGMICAVMLLDEDGRHLRYGAAPSLPARWQKAIDGLQVGPRGGSCGAAVHSGKRVIASDIASDPIWADQRELALPYGLRACSSVPIKSSRKEILGALALFDRKPHSPSHAQLELLERTERLAALVLELRKNDEALRRAEERFRTIAELSSDWYWEQDAEYRFVRFEGRNVEHDSIHDPARLIGKRRWETGAELLKGSWEEHRKLLEARRPYYDLEVKIIDSQGREHLVVASGMPFFDAHGNFRGYRGTGHDVTARRRAEQLLYLEHTVARSIADASSMSAALKAVLRIVCEAQGWDCGRYFRADDKAGLLRFAESWAKPGPQYDRYIERSRDVTYARGVGLAGIVWQSGEPIWVSDIAREPRVAQKAMTIEAGIHGAFVFPLVSDGKTIGVLTFNSRETREPDEHLLQGIRAIGAQIGQFVQRKQAEEVLRESEERFRSLTGLSSDWYWEQDENFCFTEVSENLRQRTGSSPESIIGKARWELPTLNMTEEDWAAHRALLEAHQPFRDLEWHRIDAQGQLHIAHISGKPIFDANGRFRGYRGIGKDVTESKQREEALSRFRASMDMSGDMILLVDRATMRFIDVNETVCRNLGYSREEFLAMAPEDILPVTRKELEDLYDQMIASGSTQAMQSYYRCKDGSKLPFESRRRVMRSGKSWIIVATARDIRERIAQEEALSKSNERFDMAVRATNDVIRDWNLATDELWWNENFTKVFGYARETIDPGAKSWYEHIHPDDQGRVIAGIHRFVALGGEKWSEEYRFRREDGSYAHVLDRGHAIRDETGRAVRLIGAMADISSRKQDEERIHHQALQQRLIAEFGQQALASTDLDDVLGRAVELVSVTLKADYCNVLELEPEEKQLLYKAAAGWPAEWIGQRRVMVRPGSRSEFVLTRREPLITKDYERETRFPPSPLAELGVRSGIEVPIFGTAGTFGMLTAHAREARRFSHDDVSFLQSVANILAVAIERKNAEDRLAHLARFDALTGLPNRYLFRFRLLQTMAQARRSGQPMAVLFIDLDHFKLVNDTQGHSAGDKLLKEAADRLVQCVRSGDTVGRFGGDEFGAIVSELARPGDADLVAQKILATLSRPFHLEGHETYVTASIGITVFPVDGDNPETLVMNADTAMYRSKEQGRNTYQYFTREMNERAIARVQMEAALRRAIERREFLLHYQPKVDLASRRICGFEALLRWQHPDKGLVHPGDFVSVLEDTGLIVRVGEFVLRNVCEQIQAWRSSGIEVRPVTVNVSARQFQQKDFEAVVRSVIRDTGVDASLVQFELTESLLMSDPASAAHTLRGLKASGVSISVDDFGTGYSSLAYLKRFPLDALKIDRSFVRDITTDPEDATITLAIIGLAHSLKLKVVAEGVETREQLALLAANGCDEMQGYLFSKPTTPEACASMLRDDLRLP